MSRGTIEDAALETEIGRLPALSLLELRNRWKMLFGHSAPKSLRRNFLARAIAYQMQVEAHGGLSVVTKRRLREIANAITGTNWNGFAFFGIKRAPSGNKNASGPRRTSLRADPDGSAAPPSKLK